MILSIINPIEFTKPLAFPNPKIVGNVGERSLQFNRWYFNPAPAPEKITTPLLVQFGPAEESFDRSIDLLPGGNIMAAPVVVIKMDVADLVFPDGEHVLRVEHGGAVASIIVRVNQTDLDLVSAWPVTTTDQAAAAELHQALLQKDMLISLIADSQNRLQAINARIPLLESLLK